MTVSLSARMRAATKDLHAAVERAGAMGSLLQGKLSRAGYLALLRNLHAIYRALEAGLAPQPVPATWRVLARADALERDLDALLGPGRTAAPALQPAAVSYVAHLQGLAAARPALLAAHAYVRYLGDLNGGQVLARLVAKALHLQPGEAVAFYDFGPAERVAELAQAFRQDLDAWPRDALEADALVDEARSAFERHRELFEQLGSGADVH
jgi:heme oxygenase (biliverdin-producing, ferredoxin)